MNELHIQPTSTVPFGEFAIRLYLIIAEKLISNCPYTKDMTDKQLEKYSNITITVKEYMDILGIKDRATACQQLNSAVCTIMHTTFLCDKAIETKVNGRIKTKVARYESPILIETEVNEKGGERSYVINGHVKCKLTLNIMRQLMQC